MYARLSSGLLEVYVNFEGFVFYLGSSGAFEFKGFGVRDAVFLRRLGCRCFYRLRWCCEVKEVWKLHSMRTFLRMVRAQVTWNLKSGYYSI